jgi:hypothetical protein
LKVANSRQEGGCRVAEQAESKPGFTPGTATPAIASAPQEVGPSAILPDGVGLTLEQAKALIVQNSGVILANDEPALMGVTICNAYLGELQKLHERHSKGLAMLMAEKSDAHVSGVNAAVGRLSESLSSASVEGVRKVFKDHAATLQSFKNAVFWATGIVAASAILNVTVFVLRGLR